MVLEIDNKIDIERVDLGTIEKPNLFSKQNFNLEGSFSNLSFRFFIVEGHDVKASKEKVVPSGIFEGDKRTLIRVEVDNLGEIAWRVYPLDGKSEPVLKINENQEANLINLLREPAGRLLIFQNALEQILWIFIYEADENSDWVKDWEKFLSLKEIEVPPRGEDKSSYNNWIEETMILLSNDFNLLTEYIKNIKRNKLGIETLKIFNSDGLKAFMIF